MTNSRRRLKAITYTAIGLTAALVIAGIAMTVYALVGLDRGSSSFNATLLWAQVSLIAGVVIGVSAIILRRTWSRRLPPPENAKA